VTIINVEDYLDLDPATGEGKEQSSAIGFAASRDNPDGDHGIARGFGGAVRPARRASRVCPGWRAYLGFRSADEPRGIHDASDDAWSQALARMKSGSMISGMIGAFWPRARGDLGQPVRDQGDRS
jgi:hypothetical protein